MVFFGRLGEIAGTYLKKGSKVYIEGSLRTRKWQDKQSGQDKYVTEIVADEMQMLDSRGGESGGFSSEPRQAMSSSRSGNAGGGQQQSSAPPAGFDQFDDDIPF